jgi:hypothetical protein
VPSELITHGLKTRGLLPVSFASNELPLRRVHFPPSYLIPEAKASGFSAAIQVNNRYELEQVAPVAFSVIDSFVLCPRMVASLAGVFEQQLVGVTLALITVAK